jgi:hypothetical protein
MNKNMFTRFITASALSVTLAFSSAAFAASTSFIDNGSYTTDTISGLDWLDIPNSLGKTHDYVSSRFGAGDAYEGYRYATGTEFIELINNYTGSTIDTSIGNRVVLPNGSLPGLIELLGNTYPHSRGLEGIIADVSPVRGFSLTYYLTAWAVIRQGRGRGGPYHYEEVDQGNRQRQDVSITYKGSFLVRDTLNPVPIPAAAFMFAPALLGFLGLRRRSKQA